MPLVPSGRSKDFTIFFSSSTHWWEIFKEHVPRKTVKRICETRWSSQHDAVAAVESHLEEICEALEQLRDGETETYETRSDSTNLLDSMNCYVFIAYLVFWKSVLVEINDGQKVLQSSGLGLDACIVKLGSFETFFEGTARKPCSGGQKQGN